MQVPKQMRRKILLPRLLIVLEKYVPSAVIL